jgi:hypothetical protein
MDNPELVVFATDKNLGPAIMERKIYVERALTDHLMDASTYQQLSKLEFHAAVVKISATFKRFMDKFFPTGGQRTTESHKLQQTFLNRSFEAAADSENPFNYFYLLAKVHKTPWKTRPIVSCSGSLLHGLGRWVDKELQRIVKHLPFYLKGSVELAHDLANLGKLPETTRFFSCDALIAALRLIMEHNVFVFGDTFWQQLTGTAMGMPHRAHVCHTILCHS